MRKIGRYTITGRLGRGGMSTVYKASAPITGRTVALKVLKPREEIFVDLVGMKRLKEIFIEEARVMGEITHDQVAKILDCNEDDDNPFIVLEYFAHSIGSLIGEGYQVEKPSRIISINKSYHYIRQSLLGLERLHFSGIVHRDIKPYNLMLTTDDRVKIIDFGLSRVRGEEKMSIPGMQVGSPYYAAPEQEADPAKADERADLFSLGIMAYRMLTGNLVHARQKMIPPPSEINNELNKDWDDFLFQSMSFKPEARFSSALAMRSQLENVYEQWKGKSQQSCAFLAFDHASPQLKRKKLRNAPEFIKKKQLRDTLDLDHLMRPEKFREHRFEYKDNLVFTCIDTALTWQRNGTGFPLSWQKAQEFISYLNEKKWHGRNHWRLPTTEELYSLLRPPSLLRDFCYESHLNPSIHWLWSSDSCTRKSAWIVDVQESYFHPLDKDGLSFVCGVTDDE